MTSAKISIQKSGWMILQSIGGVAIGWACNKIQAKLGLAVPVDAQTQMLAAWAVLATAGVHGMTNYVKHVWMDFIAVKNPKDQIKPV